MAQTTHGQSWPGAVLSKFSAASAVPVQTIPEVQSGLLSLFKLDHTLSSTQEKSLRSVPEQLIFVPFIYYGTTSHGHNEYIISFVWKDFGKFPTSPTL